MSFNHTTVLYIVIVALLIIIFTQHCYRDNVQKKLIIPEKTGVFNKDVVKEIDSISDVHFKEIIKDSIINIVKEKRDSLIQDFKIKDEPQKTIAYQKATSIKTYNNKLENDDIIITYSAVTQGSLEDLSFDYKIKQQSITVDDVKPKSHFLYGGSIKTNTTLERLDFNVNMGVQNKKGNIILVSYGTDKSVSVGYLMRL